MAKGSVGVSMGASIEYRYQLKPETKNCKNCVYYQNRTDPLTGKKKYGWCKQFKISISDATNAKYCKGFRNKHSGQKRKTIGAKGKRGKKKGQGA